MIQQPTITVYFRGKEREFPAHIEREDEMMMDVRGRPGPIVNRLVPDSEDGIEFTQTVDGKWYAYETQRGG